MEIGAVNKATIEAGRLIDDKHYFRKKDKLWKGNNVYVYINEFDFDEHGIPVPTGCPYYFTVVNDSAHHLSLSETQKYMQSLH